MVWSSTLTVGENSAGAVGFSLWGGGFGSLTNRNFEVQGNWNMVNVIGLRDGALYLVVVRALPWDFTLRIGEAEYDGGDNGRDGGGGYTYRWTEPTLPFTAGETVSVSLLEVVEPNTPATGQPAISSTAQVGQTLTAETSGIADEDGLTSASFTYQWLADGADIPGATGSAYTLADTDEGKAISVRVTFTDNAGNDESLTSAATDAVAAAADPHAPQETQAANSPATGAPTISGTAQVGETLTTDTSAIADADGLTNVTFSYQWMADDLNIQDATGSTRTLTDSDQGKAIKVKTSFTDDSNNAETLTSQATTAIAPRPKTPAAGGPSLQGVLQDGQELTADTVSIADADGLDNATIYYQWIRVDDGTPSDITGQIASTYTLTTDEVGQSIQLQVSFTDDRGTAESLTSAVTDAVVASGATRKLIWLSTIKVDDHDNLGLVFSFDSSADEGRLSPAAFAEGETTYSVAFLGTSFHGTTTLEIDLSSLPTTEQTSTWRLVLLDTELELADATMTETNTDPPSYHFEWDVTALAINDRNL